MPLLNGLEAVRQLKKTDSSVKVVFLTMHADVDFATEAFWGRLRVPAEAFGCRGTAQGDQPLQYITPLVARACSARSWCSNSERVDLRRGNAKCCSSVVRSRRSLAFSTRHERSSFTSNLVKVLGVRTTAELTRLVDGNSDLVKKWTSDLNGNSTSRMRRRISGEPRSIRSLLADDSFVLRSSACTGLRGCRPGG